MHDQGNRRTDLETQTLNQVVARLYLDLSSSLGPEELRSRTKPTLDEVDDRFGMRRPSVTEIRRTIEERTEGGDDLGGELRARILAELVAYYQAEFGPGWEDEMRDRVQKGFDALLDEAEVELPDAERRGRLASLLDEVLGFGPLEPYLDDEAISEIMVDGPSKIYMWRHERLEDVPARFRDEGELMGCIRRILMPTGHRLDESNPMVDARLPDGSRVNVVIPPLSLIGPLLTIRKLSGPPMTVEELIRLGTWSEGVVQFVRACVRARVNIVLSGSAESGKTTLLNLITEMIPGGERVVTVEERAELQPRGIENLVRLESQPPDWEGVGGVSMRDLVTNALRMRPDRIIVSEARGPEVLTLLRAMSTGHDGTLINMHAASPQDALARLETMALMANPSLPMRTVRHEIASALDLILHQERQQDGSRKVVKVSELAGVQGDAIVLQDIYEFRQTGYAEGRVTGYHTATGAIPTCLVRIAEAGIDLPVSAFVPRREVAAAEIEESADER